MTAAAREMVGATAWVARSLVEGAEIEDLRAADERLRQAGRAKRQTWRVVHAELVRRETAAALERMRGSGESDW